ncbi:MAG TPA: 50S ribosomal protein L21 [Thermotogota bacterium]|nr:50S ribosomal protein L21 [Thermotogota bacterium]HPJ88076.1 50S ribosomal protein L21 [Thermotogota bacterium]HPR96261.1 50S ribosomal protein L21 [Thermotogota bacterium]
MYAIIETGGRQYKVEEGSVVYVDKTKVEPGNPITFDKVVMISDDAAVAAGKPYVEGAKVVGTVMENVREDKVMIIKFKSRKMYRRTRGHRQTYTAVKVDKIEQ